MKDRYFAKLDTNNIVVEVHSLSGNQCCDYLGVNSEDIGVGVLKRMYGSDTIWKLTSKKDDRKNFARVGYSYNAELDAFVPPQPYASWTLNNSTANWDPPITQPTPDDAEKYYQWNEDAYQADNTQGWEFPLHMRGD